MVLISCFYILQKNLKIKDIHLTILKFKCKNCKMKNKFLFSANTGSFQFLML